MLFLSLQASDDEDMISTGLSELSESTNMYNYVSAFNHKYLSVLSVGVAEWQQ